MLISISGIHHVESMGKHKAIVWRPLVPLLFWASIALVIMFLPPVPQEPENLTPETWSYYGNGAPLARQILKYRNEILLGILICAVVSEVIFVFLEKRREYKK